MSVQTEVSSTLFWRNFEGSVDKEPLFVQYNNYDAQNASASDVSWYIESPANGVLLDNEVWINWKLKITDSVTGAIRKGFSDNTTSADTGSRAAANTPNSALSFRNRAVLQGACQNIALDINGTVMTYEISKYQDALNRLFMTEEESHSAFPEHGGGFDSGCHSGLFPGFFPSITIPNIHGNAISIAGLNVTGTTVDTFDLFATCNDWKGRVEANRSTSPWIIGPFVPNNDSLVNKGFRRRLDDFEYKWRTQTDATKYSDLALDSTSMSRYPQVIVFDMWEKLMISPFHFYDNRDIKMSIPNIRTFQLTFQLFSNWQKHMLRSCIERDFTGATFDFYSTKPKLYMRWYTPPPGYVIPKQVTMPVTKIMTYTNSALGSVDLSEFALIKHTFPISINTAFNVSNISFPAVPDLFLIFFKRQLSSYQYNYPDDYNLSIKRIFIDMEGNSGKLNNAQPIHFWNMYKRHLRLYPCDRDKFEMWYKYHCVLVISPSDLGVIKGPGMDNPIQLSVSNIQLESYHMPASIGCLTNFATVSGANVTNIISADFNYETGNSQVQFDLHICAVYDKYALTLTSDGSSALQLLRVNSQGTSTAPPMAVGPSSLADISI